MQVFPYSVRRDLLVRRCALLAALVLVAGNIDGPSSARAQIPTDALLKRLQKPPEDRPVLDLAGILSPAERAAIEERALKLRKTNGAALVVAIIPSLEGGEVDDFASKLYENWGIGSKERDDGVLLLVALEDRKARIETGYGLEGILPDSLAGRVLDQQLFPAFKQKRYAAGLQAAVDRIAEIVEKGEHATQPERNGEDGKVAIILFLALFVGIGALVAGFALGSPLPTKGGLFSFGAMFVGVGLVVGCMVAFLLALAIHVPVAALAGFFGFNLGRSSNFRGGKKSRGSWSDWNSWDRRMPGGPSSGGWIGGGSDWGGGGFSSGSWGGFGGGRSGGGGASGGW